MTRNTTLGDIHHILVGVQFIAPNLPHGSDVNHSQPEERWFTVGYDGSGLLLAVAHTFQIVTTNNVRIRIISARKATPREREFYENEPR